MAASDSDNILDSLREALLVNASIRELMGLTTENLLPGLSMAAKLLYRGDGEGALRIYSALVLFDPTEPRFQTSLAACAVHIRQFALGLQAASAVIALNPDGPEGYHLSGHACLGLGEHEPAVDDFTEALRLARAAGHRAIAEDSQRMLNRLSIAREAAALTAAGQPTAAAASA